MNRTTLVTLGLASLAALTVACGGTDAAGAPNAASGAGGGSDITCGVGTHLVGSTCVANATPPDDAGSDAGPETGGGGGVPFAVGDTLFLKPTSIGLVPWQAVCFKPQIQHEDGTTTVLASGDAEFSVVPQNTAVAISAEPGDCDVAGAIAVAPGTTTIAVHASSGGTTLSAVASMVVVQATLTPQLNGPFVVAVGDSELLTYDYTFTMVVGSLSGLSNGGVILPRFVNLSVASPIATAVVHPPGPLASAGEFPAMLLTGVSPGTTTVTLTYGPPGNTTSSGPVGVTVPSPGTLQAITGVELSDDAGVPVEVGQTGGLRTLPPGSCFTSHLMGNFVNPSYSGEVKSGVTWTSHGTVKAAAAGSSKFCTTTGGDAVIVGCEAGNCAYSAFPTYAPSSLGPLTATLSDMSFVGGFSQGQKKFVCPPVRFMVTPTGGAAVDVTDSPAIVLASGPINGPLYFSLGARAFLPDGTPIDDAAGNPCIVLQSQQNGGMDPAPLTIDVSVYYGDAKATSFNVNYNVPPT